MWSPISLSGRGARLSGGMHNSNPYQTKSCSRTHTMISLSDLPTGALAHVSSYLASPLSCALFAAALNHRDVDSSTVITGSQWDALDFGHIEKELAAKLTDDDINAVLTHIDAVNNIKKLRLTNCINITGVGLEPLRGSIIIQQIMRVQFSIRNHHFHALKCCLS